MTPDAKSLPDLIAQLAQRHHGGAIYPMGQRIGLSPAIVDKWAKGMVRNPSLSSIRRLCHAYGLNFHRVLEIIERGAIAGLLALLLGSWPTSAAALPVDLHDKTVPLIRSRGRNPWGSIWRRACMFPLLRCYPKVYSALLLTTGYGGDGHPSTAPLAPAVALAPCA